MSADTEPSPSPRRGVIPTFRQPDPIPDPEPPQFPPAGPSSPSSPPAGPPATHHPSPHHHPADTNALPTPTGSSSPGSKPKLAEVTVLVVGLLTLMVAGATMLARYRTGRQLRHPTRSQYRSVAEPLARIGLRHFDTDMLPEDLGDVIAAGAAAGAYITDGPLLLGPSGLVDAGVPDNLQEDQ